MELEFEWDSAKERKNLQKHGIDFTAASKVFLDDFRIERYDAKNSSLWEDRYITIGSAGENYLIVSVAYTKREERIRIISARIASKSEMEDYQNGIG